MIRWKLRGIGKEMNLPCFVTGEKHDEEPLKNNLSGFVETKQEGEYLVEMFSGHARLDYRPWEPNWIQVKVGVSKQFLGALKELERRVRANQNLVTEEIIKEVMCLSPDGPKSHQYTRGRSSCPSYRTIPHDGLGTVDSPARLARPPAEE